MAVQTKQHPYALQPAAKINAHLAVSKLVGDHVVLLMPHIVDSRAVDVFQCSTEHCQLVISHHNTFTSRHSLKPYKFIELTGCAVKHEQSETACRA